LDSTIKINPTKYSGLPLDSLIFLVKTKAPVDERRKREVWRELYHRYFLDGREFNLYSILKGEPLAFGNTVAWELNAKEVQIPVNHAEDFIRDLLDFIEFINRHVLSSPNIQFDWQLHEMAGIKSMIERVRDAKINDLNTRQKINLFIDNMNSARREALLQIEAAKNTSQAPAVEGMVNADHQITISEERTALMKQELKRLEIPISKVTKRQWEDMMDMIRIYYPEDQKKIIRHGIKKYPYDTSKKQPWHVFIENVEMKRQEINMIYVLYEGIRVHGLLAGLQILCMDSLAQFMGYLKAWFLGASNGSEEAYVAFRKDLLHFVSKRSGYIMSAEPASAYTDAKKLYSEYVLDELDKHFWIVEKYENGPLSELLHTPGVFPGSSARFEEDRRVKFKYAPSGEAIITKPAIEDRTMSVLDLYYLVYDILTERAAGLAENEESYIRTGDKFRISPLAPLEYHAKIRRFCQLPLSLKIDPGCVSRHGGISTNRDSIERILIYRFIRKAITTSEIKWLYTSQEGYSFFRSNTTVSRSQGMFHSHEDYVAEFFEEVLPFFSFQEADQLKRFFALGFTSKMMFGPYPKLSKDVAFRIVRKLQDEIPHELMLVSEFFDGIDHEYTEFELKAEFEDLSPMELFLLSQQGIEVGKEIQYKGFKETLGNGSVIHFTPEEARTRFIIDYYKNYYGSNK
jgi:hypothetical protein